MRMFIILGAVLLVVVLLFIGWNLYAFFDAFSVEPVTKARIKMPSSKVRIDFFEGNATTDYTMLVVANYGLSDDTTLLVEPNFSSVKELVKLDDSTIKITFGDSTFSNATKTDTVAVPFRIK